MQLGGMLRDTPSEREYRPDQDNTFVRISRHLRIF